MGRLGARGSIGADGLARESIGADGLLRVCCAVCRRSWRPFGVDWVVGPRIDDHRLGGGMICEGHLVGAVGFARVAWLGR